MSAAIPLRRQRNLILGALLALAAGAWALVSWQAFAGPAPPAGANTASLLTSGMAVTLFMGMWVAMMVAMMFPAAAPMILIFSRLQTSRRVAERPYVPTAFFVSAYLLVWATAGVLAFLGAQLAGGLADRYPGLSQNGSRIAGVLLVLAGVYQLTPLKATCLRTCRSPMSFILNHWREGRLGSVRMGVQHGLFCLGCCWLLFLLLFPLGIMNIAAMAAVAVLVFAEKATPWGARLSIVLGGGLIAYGLVVVILPSLLPGTFPAMQSMSMG